MNKLKLLLAVLMCLLLIFTSQRLYNAKMETVSDIYSDIIFTHLSVETQQYTRQIEYGLKNGKSLENFYNIQSVLSDVRRCSSYTAGAYILSDSYDLLYSLSDDNEPPITSVCSGENITDEKIYSVLTESRYDRYLLTLPIYGKDDVVCGYMILNIHTSVVENMLSDYKSENEIQAAVIAALAFLAGAVALIHLCRTKEKILRHSAAVMGISVCGAAFTDAAISVYKLKLDIESIIQQSVSKINMTLQNDLDTVHEKGAELNKIYDLNSWLLESRKGVPFIDNLIYDKNYRITAVVSESYTTGRVLHFALALAALIGIFAAAAAVLYIAARIADKFLNGKKASDNK